MRESQLISVLLAVCALMLLVAIGLVWAELRQYGLKRPSAADLTARGAPAKSAPAPEEAMPAEEPEGAAASEDAE